MKEHSFYIANVGKLTEVAVRRKCELAAKLFPLETGTLNS
jgi:hypothetical protein